MQDFRDAFRALRATPAVSLVAVLSLALGIGANTAIFSLIDSVLLRNLPVRDAHQLVYLEDGSWTNPIWEQIRDRQDQLFAGALAWSDANFDLAQGGEAEWVEGLWVSGGFFKVLGVTPVLGRMLTPDDDRRGGSPDGLAAVISYRFWQRRFAGAADAVGQTLVLNRTAYRIVGVTPPEFFGPEVGKNFDVAVAIGSEPVMRGAESWLDRRSTWWLRVMARLKPGQTVEEATAALRGVQPQIRAATVPDNWRPEELERYLHEGFQLVPAAAGASSLRARYRNPLLLLMGIVGLVLLIACANIANLLLARAAARRHEMSVRLALGAPRWRLARQLLAESLLLAGLGAAAGLLLAQAGSRLLVTQLSTRGQAVFLDLTLDWRVLGFTAAACIATALLFGLAPVFRTARVEPVEALKSQGRGLAGGGRRVLGHPLVAAQVALSLVLVFASGLFLRTFAGLATQHLGFDSGPVLTVSVDVQRLKLEPERRTALLDAIRDEVARVPGVARSAVSVVTPVSGSTWNSLFEFPGITGLSERDRIVNMNYVTSGWFGTYGTPLLSGRDFTAHDRSGAPDVGIVNEAFARKYYGGASPLGRTVTRPGRPNRAPRTFEIVGLVGDAVYRSLREPVPPTLYLPFGQMDEPPSYATVSLRAAGGAAAALTGPVAAAVGRVNKEASLNFRPLADQISSSLSQERLIATLSGFFGALALLLAGMGLYGVTAYSVHRQRAEIGIRMALGADDSAVVLLVLGRVARLVIAGIVAGAGISLWSAQFVESLLYDLKPHDPLTLAAAALLLTAISGVAGWLPARRAARIQPASILRN